MITKTVPTNYYDVNATVWVWTGYCAPVVGISNVLQVQVAGYASVAAIGTNTDPLAILSIQIPSAIYSGAFDIETAVVQQQSDLSGGTVS